MTSGTYTFTNVQAPHTISATFTQAAATITASVVGGGGSVTPAGVTSVALGGSLTYTITPNNGYSRATVKVDGIDQPAAVTSGTYTFSAVAANHTISATFAPNVPTTVTVTSPNGGESWAPGSPQTLTWSVSTPVLTGDFQLWVVDSANTYYYVGSKAVDPALTNYSLGWNASLPVASDYKLTVYYRPDASVWSFTLNDISDAAFAIGTPAAVLTVTSPNGGESWAPGSPQTLTWSVSTPVLTGDFQLWVVDSANTYYYVGSKAVDPALTNYSLGWNASLPVASDYKLTVYYRPDASVWSFTLNDISDAAFAIGTPAAVLTVTSPNGGESWAPGSPQTLTWSVSTPVLTGDFQLWVVDSANTYYYVGSKAVDPALTNYSLGWNASLPVASDYKLTVYYRPNVILWSFTLNDASNATFAIGP